MIAAALDRFQNMMGTTPSMAVSREGMLAAGLTIAAMLVSWGVMRAAAPTLAHLWEKRAGYESDLARRRIRHMTRRATLSVLVALLLFAWPWTLIAQAVFGITLALAAALFVNDLIRGVRLPDWLGTAMALVTLVAILAGTTGGIDPLTRAFEAVGFTIGERRFSLAWAVGIVVTIVALLAAMRVAGRLIGHAVESSPRLDAAQKLLIRKVVSVVLMAAAFFIGIDVLGIDLTALAFFSGAFGLAIGFGMQKTIGNLIAGIILLMDRSIKPGDVIVIKDTFGWVNKIGVRAVSVLTRDGKEHLIPNENLMTTEVENWSFSDTNIRIRIPVPVSYRSDMRLVEKLLYQAARDVPRVLERPETKVWMMRFADSAVEFEIRCWINDPQGGVGNVTSQVLWRVWELFREHGIEIPFPQQDVHVRMVPGKVGEAEA